MTKRLDFDIKVWPITAFLCQERELLARVERWLGHA